MPPSCKRMNAPLHIVLFEPEIPPNTGNIARLCACTGIQLHLVHPLGFDINDKQLKRAGLDYWRHVTIRHWQHLDEYLVSCDEKKIFFYTTKVSRPYYSTQYPPGSSFIFGKETKGLPEETIALYHDRCYTIPMKNRNIRSLNLAMSAGIVLYEAIRQKDCP